MTQFDLEKFTQTQLSILSGGVESLQQGRFELTWSIRIARIIGYGLLVLAFLDLIETFMSLDVNNALSLFQTIGTLVDRVPVTFIGLLLVFLGGLDERNKWEALLLKFLSWLTLVVGILFILLIPVGIGSTMQANNTSTTQIDAQYKEKLSQLNGTEQRLKQAAPEAVADVIKRQGGSVEGKTPQQLKDKVVSDIGQLKTQLQFQANAEKSKQRKALLKKSVKLNVGALLSGALFISLWKGSSIARAFKSAKKQKA
jgi:hypothetical protein